jgi:cobalt-zinc-cadmium efflux system membrane fusion protein
VIDSAELGAAQGDYLQRRTAVETARPAVDLAQAASERLQKLYEQTQGTTLTEVETRKREYAAARGDLAAAEAALRAAANRLQLLGMDEAAVAALGQSGKINPAYAIKSPIGGRVVEREVTRGELVGPDKPRLMMLADLGTVWVLADVPEAELGQITDAAAAHVTVTATGGDPLEGKVAHVAAELDPATRTGRVRIEVSNPDLRLRPGMFGRVEIAAGAAGNEPVLAVPEEAIQTVEGDASVFVPVSGEPNTFAKRAVGIGPAVGGMVPVFAGLKEGEQYVVRGAFTLKAELGKGGAAHDH